MSRARSHALPRSLQAQLLRLWNGKACRKGGFWVYQT